jgi:hypothetical protein
MASANSNIQISDLDFDAIKTNLKTFLRSQDKFKDYDFEGSALSNLIDLLAYNTHYNSYYLNMVANEMFLDTAALRSSVVSHAKLLNYTPKSSTAPTATINLSVSGLTNASLTLPKFTAFSSEAIDGVNYRFITKDVVTRNVSAGTALFSGLQIIQGEPISLTFTYSSSSNPKAIFSLPDFNIDTSTVIVQIQTSTIDTTITNYTRGENVLNLNENSTVYFLQEGLNNNYEIYFGDNILGKKLIDGNIVRVSYVVTNGTSSLGANNFVLLDTIGGVPVISPLTAATNGSDKESIDSIKYTAPKAYSAQGRAVTVEDYISVLQNNNIGLTFDSVNVWGGVDYTTPAFGQVFISLKPSGAYNITDTQKQRLINDVLKPVSVVTVTPTIIDPDYTYIKVTADVVYEQKNTNLSSAEIQDNVKTAIRNFSNASLNTFNSLFDMSDLSATIKDVDSSIVATQVDVKVQKKFYPILGVHKNYTLNYGVSLERGVFTAGINSYPTIKYYTDDGELTLINDVYLEEVPFPSSGIESINILNIGFGYTENPIVTITGDGEGATATATVVNASISKINVTNSGNNYTQAIVTIENAPGDTNGNSGTAYAILRGQYGKLRSYYYDSNNKKTILNDDAGSIDYYNGTVSLTNFNPNDVNDPLGQLTITATPETTIIESTKNRIVSIDEFDAQAVIVNVTAK